MKVSCAAAVAPTPPGAMSVTWYRESEGEPGEGEGGGRAAMAIVCGHPACIDGVHQDAVAGQASSRCQSEHVQGGLARRQGR